MSRNYGSISIKIIMQSILYRDHLDNTFSFFGIFVIVYVITLLSQHENELKSRSSMGLTAMEAGHVAAR